MTGQVSPPSDAPQVASLSESGMTPSAGADQSFTAHHASNTVPSAAPPVAVAPQLTSASAAREARQSPTPSNCTSAVPIVSMTSPPARASWSRRRTVTSWAAASTCSTSTRCPVGRWRAVIPSTPSAVVPRRCSSDCSGSASALWRAAAPPRDSCRQRRSSPSSAAMSTRAASCSPRARSATAVADAPSVAALGSTRVGASV